jgi:hypothetical protein
MPVKKCSTDGRPGWKWGDAGRCYTYEPGSEKASVNAKKKAIAQGIAIEGPEGIEDLDLDKIVLILDDVKSAAALARYFRQELTRKYPEEYLKTLDFWAREMLKLSLPPEGQKMVRDMRRDELGQQLWSTFELYDV